MKKEYTLIAISALLLASAAIVYFLDRPDSRSHQGDERPNLLEAAQSTKLVPELKLDQLLERRSQTKGEEFGELAESQLVDGSVSREWGTFISAKDIRVNCRDEQEVVRPNPQPDDFVRKCDTRTEFDHPYAQFTNEQLRQIAGYDAEAAYLLSYRMLVQPGGAQSSQYLGEALSYAMTALILTGEKQAFDLFIDGRKFNNWSVWSTNNGIPNEREVREKAEEYSWLLVGRNMGYIKEDSSYWQEVSREVETFDQYFDVDALTARADELSKDIIYRRSIAAGKTNEDN